MDGGIEGGVKFKMNEVGKVCGGMKRVFKCRSLGITAKRSLYEGVVVPTALYGAETWNMGAEERRRLNIMETRNYNNCKEKIKRKLHKSCIAQTEYSVVFT